MKEKKHFFTFPIILIQLLPPKMIPTYIPQQSTQHKP